MAAAVDVKRLKAEDDLISNLTDDILESIITHLPADEAARTSVLSTRWRSIWKGIPDLDLSSLSNRIVLYGQFNDLVTCILRGHNAPIRSCQVQLYDEDLSWLYRLLEMKTLVSLSLECQENIFNFLHTTDHVISGSIRKLYLTNWSMLYPNLDFVYQCTNLTELSLSFYNIDLRTIFEKCKMLEILRLENCNHMESIHITDCPTLKNLTLKVLPYLTKLKISLTELKILVLDEIDSMQEIELFTPNLSVLKILGAQQTNSEVLSICGGLYNKNGTSPMPTNHRNQYEYQPFLRLRHLAVDLDMNNFRTVVTLSCVLKTCVELRELVIGIEQSGALLEDSCKDGEILAWSKEDYWGKQLLYDCLKYTLWAVEIRGFSGQMLEVEFLKFLVGKGNVLERLTVWFEDNDDRSVVQAADVAWEKLVLLPKASSNLKMELKICNQVDYSLF